MGSGKGASNSQRKVGERRTCLLTNYLVHKSSKFPWYPWLFISVFTLLNTHSFENLVDSPDVFGMSPLMVAAQKGYTRLVQTDVCQKF